MNLNLLSDKDEERSLSNAAPNGYVRAQEELGRRYRIFIWCKNDLKVPSASGGRCLSII